MGLRPFGVTSCWMDGRIQLTADVAMSPSKTPFIVPVSICSFTHVLLHLLTRSFNKFVLSSCYVPATKVGPASKP